VSFTQVTESASEKMRVQSGLGIVSATGAPDQWTHGCEMLVKLNAAIAAGGNELQPAMRMIVPLCLPVTSCHARGVIRDIGL